MARGYVLHCEQSQKEFGALPIRIGRNALNDFPLPFGIVSAFHARIEEENGVIGIVDLHSKNGVFVRPPDGSLMRIPPGQHVPLEGFGNEFLVGPNVPARLEVFDGRTTERSFSGTVLGNKRWLGADRQVPTPQHGAAASQYPASLPALQPIRPLPSLDASRPATSRPPPPAYQDPRHRPPSAPPPSPERHGTQQFNIGLHELALTGLKELAGSLVPGQTITTTGDVARLVTRLHDAVEVFSRCFIPIREGHAQFVSNLDLQREATQRRQHRSSGYARVETARTPEEVAAALLDFRDPSEDAAAAIEGIFADLMVHQVALLDGVMQGVRALLDELSPDNIERAVEANSTAIALALNKHRTLWQEFQARYEELSVEKQALKRIFGPEFSEAYRNYGARKKD